ncbi:chromatin modification-related protein EAF1 B isoform X2 [Cryptomeria japonica]|uniref:chromatin modification-related protein EAF1 B isoform X2 n=1 Tax=Cryptomeria japonica TaxID=3369 RepID=UPI0027DA2986|nr:chromatin modification-related protein EAF1 B isoform X2 [Cryptomeria japonica]
MGGGVGGGVGIDSEPSPRRAAIEKAQAELRLEFVVREERRRELEFLEKGGNPLDFKFGEPTSRFLSPSPTDPLAEQYLSSLGTVLCRGLNTADNFAGDTEVVDAERGAFLCDGKVNVAQEGQTSHVEGSRTETHIKESEDSGGVRMGVKGYARRNRPKGNRHIGHASLKDSVKSGICDQSPTLAAGIKGLGEAKDIEPETLADKTCNVLSNNTSKPTSLNRNGMLETSTQKKHVETDSDVPLRQEASRDDANVNLEGSHPGCRDATCSDKVENHKCSSEVDANQDAVPIDIVTSIVGHDDANQCSSLVSDTADTDKIVQNVVIAEQSLDKGTPSCVNESDKGGKVEIECNNKASFKTAIDVGKFDTLGTISAHVQENLGSHECANATNDKTLMSERMPESRSIDNIKETTEPSCTDLHTRRRNSKPDDKHLGTSDVLVKTEEGLLVSTSMQTEVPRIATNQDVKVRNSSQLLENKEERQIGGVNSVLKLAVHQQSKSSSGVSVPSKKHSGINLSLEKGKNSGGNAEAECHKPTLSATAKKTHEDLILESAKHLKARLKKNAELAKTKPFLEPPRRDSHWDFVLAEMEWLANDFMQERRWKLTAAAQFSHEIAERIGHEEYREEELYKKQRKGARKIATSVIQFWQAAEALICCRNDGASLMSQKKMSNDEAVQKEIDESDVIMLECNKEPEDEKSCDVSPLQQYAIRYLKYMKDSDNTVQAEAPSTPERLLDAGILEPSWEDQFPEESLFYTIPCGAMELYRNSVESYWASLEKESMEAWTDADTQPGFSPRERAFCEDDELRTQYLPGAFEGSKATKARKRRKNLIKMPKTHGRIPSGESHGFSLGNMAETITGIPLTTMNGKRTASSANLNAGAPIPTKRIRSSTIAARQRAAGSLSGGTTGASGHANKTDVSSGDTSSLQEEYNTLIEGSQSRKSMDIDTCGKSLHSDGVDISLKTKKKKKSKLFGMGPSSTAMDTAGTLGLPGNGLEYEPKWQQDVTSQLDQREQTKRKLETQVFLPSTVLGSSLDHQMTNSQGIAGQAGIKKLKLSKQLSDMSPQAPATISAPSPGASQMSNMSNSSKPIKISTNRDKGRKNKTPKAAANQTGQGIAWSTFEDQALVVLVHDVGPNWELVSDIINSSLQIKCIFRKPKDCKERHKSLMERTSGDGGDSPEDSGSSQPYPSTLPGIPKGSARILLQRLQGPMEEEALKTHFEKIVQIGQQQHVRKIQNDNQELKQRAPIHPSHHMAIQNIAGTFTPLDLCDKPSSTEISPQAFPTQGAHNSGMLNSLGTVSPLQPGSVGIPSLQGPSSLPLGGNLVASSSGLNVAGASRDMQRFSSGRPISVKMDEQQQRMQQYNQLIAARNLQTPGVSMSASLPMGLPNSNDRGVRMLPGGNAAGLMPVLNRGMPLPRPGYPAIGPPGIMSLGSSGINNILPCNGVGLSTTGTVTSGAISGQGNLIPRSRDSMQMMRPSQSPEDQRQMLMQELQIQPAQGNGQAAAPYSTLNGSFSNQMASSPTQNYTGQHQQHQMPQGHSNLQNSQLQNASHSQAYMLQLQRQRLMQQQHYVSNGSQLPQSQPHPPQAKHAISTVPNNAHQQHSLPQHVLQQQHTGAQQQSKTQSPPTLQHQSPQQSGPSAMNTSVLQSAQKRQPSLPQTQGQNYQGAGQSNLLQQNQMQKQHQQRQQQLKHQAQPQQQQKSQLQQGQQQQQQNRVSKGLERGGMIMQNISADISQVNGPQGPVPGNQHPEKDQMVQLVPGQRVFHGPGSLQPGKQLIQSAMSGQQGQVPGQIPVSLPQTLALSQQQKGFMQQSSLKQQPSASLTTDNQQASVSSPNAAQLQQQMPSCQAQSCSVPMSLSSSSQQQRQSIQSQQLAHRKLPHRQSGSDVGLQPPPQPSKSCVPQQDQVSSQLSSQQGHLTFQVGSNVGGPLSTVSAGPAASLSDAVHSNNNVVNSVQWKAGAQTTSMPYSLNNHNGVSGTQISPTVSTSGMLITSTNGNAAVSTTTSSGILASGTNIAGLPQRQYTSSIGQVHGHNAGSHTAIGPRPPVQQIGVQWQPQQTMSQQQQQQRQTHNGIQSSIHNSLGSGYIDPPTSGPM